MPRVLLALGSNVDAERNMHAAAGMLRDSFPGIRFSRVYRTAPAGYEDQDDFLNAAALLETDGPPEEVHARLRAIEGALKKATPFANGPRTIDLDLLTYGNLVQDAPWLAIPHPRMHQRRFVLRPVLDLVAGTETHPALKTPWQALLDTLPPERMDIMEQRL